MVQLSGAELDLFYLLRVLRRRLLVLAILAIAIAATTFLALGFVDPIYTADTQILIEERESPLSRPRQAPLEPMAIQFDEAAIQSQVEVLRSREIAGRVIDQLDLVQARELDPAAKPSMLDALMVALGVSRPPTDQSRRQRVMETYFKSLSVYPIGKSRVITVEFDSADPEMAAQVANAVAENFIALQSDSKRETVVAATGWLEKEIADLRQRLSEAEERVERFRSGSELFETGRVDTNLSTQQLSDINAELARAKAARSEAEARAELVEVFLTEPGSIDISEEVLNSPLIQRLREREVALRAEIAELSSSLLPTHPRIQAMQMQLSDLDRQIQLEAEKVLQSLRSAARVAAARVTALQESLNEAKVEVSRSNEEQIELRALEREAASQRDLLEAFLARYREALARTNSDYLPADARVISRALPPRIPSFPKRTMMAAFVGTTILLVGAGLVLLREFMSGRAFRVGEPESADALDRTVFASRAEPQLDLDTIGTPVPPPALALPENAPGTVEVARMLAEPAVRMALFAGAQGGEGAGEIALAAARLAAESGSRPVLLDVGVRPSPALGPDGEPGLGELLSGDAAFGEVIRRMEGSRVHFIPMGTAESDPPLQRLTLVIGALAHTYDKVVIVADALGDWPAEHVRPDLAAIICGPALDEAGRKAAYEWTLEQGARSAIVVRRVAEAEEDESGSDDERQSAGAVA
ncbi:MAG TPA: exopolysaccharide transport family protein [Afifellaceae bacterium]|nr:exopolysaccharide transport family protein [Afifellaceae bacterium]